jgi:hypothetical protein
MSMPASRPPSAGPITKPRPNRDHQPGGQHIQRHRAEDEGEGAPLVHRPA